MRGDEKPAAEDGTGGEPPYRIDDVPWVQYFYGGYALHGAFWHDNFGQPKSHGCVNLSPRDALTLFDMTEPTLPDGWHGVTANLAGIEQGTVVILRW
jgi:lipoprotein-anchoring transpeptidase ErfK/SrfK